MDKTGATDTQDDRPLLIMGATSGIGALAVAECDSRGIAVRGFGRSADKMPAAPKFEPFAGDARNAEDVTRALTGARAVIYALGVKERLSMIWQPETLFSETTRVLIDAMGKTGVTRLVAVTGFGAGRSRAAMSKLERLGHGAILGKIYEDKSRQEELIVQSPLDWTIVRPVILTSGPASGRYRVLRDPSTWRNGLISRKDVAHYLVDAAMGDLDVGADVVLTR